MDRPKRHRIYCLHMHLVSICKSKLRWVAREIVVAVKY